MIYSKRVALPIDLSYVMFETIVLLMGALPFLVGLYALRKIKNKDDEGADDQPPPPDPEPPRPVLPPSPRFHNIESALRAGDRPAVLLARDKTPQRTRIPGRTRTLHRRAGV